MQIAHGGDVNEVVGHPGMVEQGICHEVSCGVRKDVTVTRTMFKNNRLLLDQAGMTWIQSLIGGSEVSCT
jgi:hypothetical protein